MKNSEVIIQNIDEYHEKAVIARVRTGKRVASHLRRYKVFQKAALDGVLVKDVADPHAADAWADYTAILREILK